MNVTMCDRCQTIMVDGVDPVYRIVKTDFNGMGMLGEHSLIDLCETCNKKFNKFMDEVDDQEV